MYAYPAASEAASTVPPRAGGPPPAPVRESDRLARQRGRHILWHNPAGTLTGAPSRPGVRTADRRDPRLWGCGRGLMGRVVDSGDKARARAPGRHLGRLVGSLVPEHAAALIAGSASFPIHSREFPPVTRVAGRRLPLACRANPSSRSRKQMHRPNGSLLAVARASLSRAASGRSAPYPLTSRAPRSPTSRSQGIHPGALHPRSFLR